MYISVLSLRSFGLEQGLFRSGNYQGAGNALHVALAKDHKMSWNENSASHHSYCKISAFSWQQAHIDSYTSA
jgi:hypothetical protein